MTHHCERRLITVARGLWTAPDPTPAPCLTTHCLGLWNGHYPRYARFTRLYRGRLRALRYLCLRRYRLTRWFTYTTCAYAFADGYNAYGWLAPVYCLALALPPARLQR